MWSESGFGTPLAIHVFYIVKICLYLSGFKFFLAHASVGTVCCKPQRYYHAQLSWTCGRMVSCMLAFGLRVHAAFLSWMPFPP
jgi:hypothetical protein